MGSQEAGADQGFFEDLGSDGSGLVVPEDGHIDGLEVAGLAISCDATLHVDDA